MSRNHCSLCIALLLTFQALTAAAAPEKGLGPTFSKSFAPDTIGPGSTSTLTFVITNPDPGEGRTDLAFTDVLPLGVTIAAAPQAASTCGGTLSAPAGGTTITFSDGTLAQGSNCTIVVNVTSATVDVHTNVSGDLTTDIGDVVGAEADLIVENALPGFTKSFAPNPTPLGSRTLLTFTIDNTANEEAATSLSFTDNLPAGLVVASPANASTTCTGGVVTAVPGSGVIGFASGSVADLASCTVSVDVVPSAAGMLGNVSGNLTSTPGGSSGMASATLDVTAAELVLIKEFTDDPVPPGGTATLELTILNRSRDEAVVDLAFMDDLDAVLSGLAATAGPTPDPPCGAGSSLTGAGLLTLSGGNLPAEGSCTFSVPVLVPAAADSGAYPNTTTALMGEQGGPIAGNQAFDVLFVSPAPLLTKTFTDDPVAAGGMVTLEFTITNTSSTSSAEDIAFTDVFAPIIPTASVVPAAGFCGDDSTATFDPLNGGLASLTIAGASLEPGESCTFSVVLDVAVAAAGGIYPNTTSAITALIGGEEPVTGNPASDDLVVVEGPRLTKEFTDDPVAPGDAVILEFTLAHDALAPADAVDVSFTDDLAATLTGLTATGLPLADLCGPGNGTLTGSAGDTLLTFAGATLTPGQTCTFPVTLQVDPAAISGIHPNTTSNVMATVAGVAVVGNPAADDLVVAGLLFTKEFIDDPVLPGAMATLRFSFENTSGTVDATNVGFTDDLDATLSGLTALGLPAAVCGGTLAGTSDLTFSGGTVTALNFCFFDVIVQVPGAAADGVYGNTTSSLVADIGAAVGVVLPPAFDTLTVTSDLLFLTKEFTDDPVAPGGTVTLQFEITNLDVVETVTDVTFTDDLEAALSGLAATGLPMAACGGTLSDAPPLTLNGASLGPGASCQFSVTLSVPAMVSPGSVATNTTSQVTGMVGAVPVTGNLASDDLVVVLLDFSKSFAGLTAAGATVQLSFTIENLDTVSGVTDVSFVDNLSAVLPGLVATGLPASAVCGVGSQLTGTSILNLTDGNLGPGASCTFNVTLQVPAGAAPGSYPNTTSDLLLAGLTASVPATALLVVEPAPLFSKSFAPNAIAAGAVSTLTFTIDNTASALAATALAFTDNLPAGVVVASPPNASTTCGGTLTAVAGTGVVTLSGGTVAAGASCTVTVDVTSAAGGVHVNTTGDLTSSLGNSGPASDSLMVGAPPAPLFSLSFAPNPVPAGSPSVLTFTIDNTGSLAAATGLDFTNALPAGLTVASPANASTDCTGGTLTAVAGTGVVSYAGGTVPASAVCTVQVSVVAALPGSYPNTSGDLTSSAGNSGPASDVLEVIDVVQEIPTLGEWALLLLASLLALLGIGRMRRS
ncbi:MAG TPA: IPTL-CTERM sorting domain-containing protein [Thermoanaerobaculia bacterium]